jgi:hypothetical protein
MSKRDLESLEKLIARLEDWQNRDTVRNKLREAQVMERVNQAKSMLLSVVSSVSRGG